jgi:hypothetical protein
MATNERKTGWLHGIVAAFVWLALMVSFSTPALAGLISTDTVHAMPGKFGTEVIQFTEEPSGKFVDGSIDYAVYAPGDFNLSFPGQDPSGGTQYVYRYQIYNNSGTSNDYMNKLTVALVGLTNLTDAMNCTWIEPGPIYPAGGIAPATSMTGITGNPPDSANWGYKSSSPPINPGSYSKMLIFTSPYEPTFQIASVFSQSTDAHWVDNTGHQYNWWEGQLPSPIPEPSSLLSLLAIGILFSVYRALRKS